MFLPLPTLDDRRWEDLVEEGRNLIPLLAPDWTDQNTHDPGITLVELFAWLVETDIFRVDRIPAAHREKFLRLAGIIPQPPRASRAILTINFQNVAKKIDLPAGVEFIGKNPDDQPIPFRTLDYLAVAAAEIASVLIEDEKKFLNGTVKWQNREALEIFSRDPKPDNALYLGFTSPLPVIQDTTLYFQITEENESETERRRLAEELRARQKACIVQAEGVNGCKKEKPAKIEESNPVLLHHSVRTVWEFWGRINNKEDWHPLNPAMREVTDNTRAFTLNGTVKVRPPQEMTPKTLGPLTQPLYYLRCRLYSGEYDAPPRVQQFLLNTVAVEQAVPPGGEWKIAPAATISGAIPQPGELIALMWHFDQQGRIANLQFIEDPETQPKFLFYEYDPPDPTMNKEGRLALEMVQAGIGSGTPNQQFILPKAPIQLDSLKIYTLSQEQWQQWEYRPDFSASARTDRHFTVDPTTGLISFGDGEKGNILPENAPFFALYRQTAAENGNVQRGTITELSASPHNQAVLGNEVFGISDPVTKSKGNTSPKIKKDLRSIFRMVNPSPSTGGSSAETLTAARARTLEKLAAEISRAVTLEDIKQLALQTPGTHLARAEVKANIHPHHHCFRAPGMITVIIVPGLPVGRPVPGAGVRQAVKGYLQRRRVVGSRIEVVGPTYTKISINAKVQTNPGVAKSRVQADIIKALQIFLDPLEGGPQKRGWPFGRDVYRSEILQLIDRVAGVDHVAALELRANEGEAQCRNLCTGPFGLTFSGEHQIEVL
jgi:hypothetical protein